MPTLDQTIDELLTLASAAFNVPREKLSADGDFSEMLRDLDSLHKQKLLTGMETHFNVELPDYEVQEATNFRELAERIHARL